MRLQAKLACVAAKFKKTSIMLAMAVVAVPNVMIAQIGEPPAGGTPDVPFDTNMNLIFLAAGLAFAVFIVVKQVRKKAQH